MALYQTQIHSCQFPSLGRVSGNDQKRPLSVRVDLQRPELLQQLFAEDHGKDSLVAVVTAAWTLVLRMYTGLEQVCFGCGEVGGLQTGHATGENVQRDSVAHLVNDEWSIAELVHRAKEDSSAADGHENFQYNTSVLFRFAVQGGTAAGNSKTTPMTMAASVGYGQFFHSERLLTTTCKVSPPPPRQGAEDWNQCPT